MKFFFLKINTFSEDDRNHKRGFFSSSAQNRQDFSENEHKIFFWSNKNKQRKLFSENKRQTIFYFVRDHHERKKGISKNQSFLKTKNKP